MQPILTFTSTVLLLGYLALPNSGGNFPGDLPPMPTPGPYDHESPLDSEAWVDELIDAPHPMALEELNGRVYANPSPEMMATVARASILIGERWLAEGDTAQAARAGLNIYLSSSPNSWRLRAMDLFVRSGDLNEVDRQLRLINQGEQDPWMWRYLADWEQISRDRRGMDGC